jgi:hypothetical protein
LYRATPSSPAISQTRVFCGGSSAGTCVDDCVVGSWSTGACNRECSGYQIVSPNITRQADGMNPVQCPAPYARACSSGCYLYLYSGQDFNGNRRGTIGPIYNPESRLFGSSTTIVNPNDLRSMNVPDGLTVKLYTERNYTGDMGTYTGPWAGRVSQWDNAESMKWSFTNGIPVQVVASSGQFCPVGQTMIGSGSTAYCRSSNGGRFIPNLRCPNGFTQDPLRTWCVRF